MKLIKFGNGKKYIIAASGIFLVSFLIAHLSGNLLLFKDDGGKSFNEYANFMSTNPGIRILEIILLLGFIVHIATAIYITIQNRRARPIKYEKNKGSANSSMASRNMGLTGSVILVFLVIHMKDFFVESRIYGEKNMYELVKTTFHDPLYTIIYLFSLFILALHLSHGFQSAFQSWGLNHDKYTPFIKALGIFLAVVLPIGFASIPVYFYIKQFV